MLPERLRDEYPDEEAYSNALNVARVSVPEQISRPQRMMPGDEMHAAWWPCGCKLPWWAFRRGGFHMYIRPDGQHVAYESCPVSKDRALSRAREGERSRRERKGRL